MTIVVRRDNVIFSDLVDYFAIEGGDSGNIDGEREETVTILIGILLKMIKIERDLHNKC